MKPQHLGLLWGEDNVGGCYINNELCRDRGSYTGSTNNRYALNVKTGKKSLRLAKELAMSQNMFDAWLRDCLYCKGDRKT